MIIVLATPNWPQVVQPCMVTTEPWFLCFSIILHDVVKTCDSWISGYQFGQDLSWHGPVFFHPPGWHQMDCRWKNSWKWDSHIIDYSFDTFYLGWEKMVWCNQYFRYCQTRENVVFDIYKASLNGPSSIFLALYSTTLVYLNILFIFEVACDGIQPQNR